MKETINLIIAGDLCPTKDTLTFFENSDEVGLFNDALPLFKEADYVVGNLEFVLTDYPQAITKAGPVLHGKTSYSKLLKQAGFEALSLANNHIKDCGELGVKSTIETCRADDFDIFGAGENIIDAKKPLIKKINGRTIGFMSFAEQEFNTASETEYGANYFDPYEDLDRITQLRSEVDYLVVLYHGGIEYYQYPSPLLKKKCRKFIDKGADLVTCQHSHCIGTYDNYKDKMIVYGQGNTLFGYRKNNAAWNEGLLIQLDWSPEQLNPKINFVPITATESGIEKLKEPYASALLVELKKRSEKIADNSFLKTNWTRFCLDKKSLYLPFLFGYNRALIHINRFAKNKFVEMFYSKSKLRTSHNIIRCEAHNEVIQTILKHQVKN